jgi:hypothetical protein
MNSRYLVEDNLPTAKPILPPNPILTPGTNPHSGARFTSGLGISTFILDSVGVVARDVLADEGRGRMSNIDDMAVVTEDEGVVSFRLGFEFALPGKENVNLLEFVAEGADLEAERSSVPADNS